MSTADKICTIVLGLIALATIAMILLQLAVDEQADHEVAVRPVTPADWADFMAGIEPVSGVPVSPNLHHYAEGRIPGPVTGQIPAATLPRHAAPGRGRWNHRIPAHAQPRRFVRSTL